MVGSCTLRVDTPIFPPFRHYHYIKNSTTLATWSSPFTSVNYISLVNYILFSPNNKSVFRLFNRFRYWYQLRTRPYLFNGWWHRVEYVVEIVECIVHKSGSTPFREHSLQAKALPTLTGRHSHISTLPISTESLADIASSTSL